VGSVQTFVAAAGVASAAAAGLLHQAMHTVIYGHPQGFSQRSSAAALRIGFTGADRAQDYLALDLHIGVTAG